MKIKNILNKLSRKSKVILGTAAAIAVVALPAAVYAGYGPNGADRVIYDFSNPAQREGAFDAPRFNSYINTDVYGDERAFVDAKECVEVGPQCYKTGVLGGYADQQPVVAGKEYIVRAYVHNIANPSINDDPATPGPMDGKGVAKNTRIRFELPNTTGVANGFTVQARISADNAIPKMVYDTVDLRNNQTAFGLSYVPDSAYIFNAAHPDGLKLSDAVMTEAGTLIGDDQMDGVYPGCFEYSSFVVIRVKATAPELKIEKLASKVEMPKMSDTSESVTVKRGENVSWRLNYANTGTSTTNNVVLRDELPKGLEIVPGSIKLTTAAGTETLQDTALGSGGVNVGDYFANGNGVIRFTTKVVTEPGVCELTNVAFVRGDNVPESSNDAKVVIEDCKPTTKKPVYLCESFTLSHKEVKVNETVTVKVRIVAKDGATFKQAVIYFGDEARVEDRMVTNKIDNNEITVTHSYKKSGTYNLGAKIDFTVDGKTVSVEDKNCVAQIKVAGVVTTVPTTLPSTGAGSIFGLMAAVTAVSAVAYRKMTLRANR